ncbi:hypothetical protein VPH35_042407 [Triticum aestivum]|uniref:Uncharacterized protein n=1 Tax=Triticum turgidum subsp. durum TaxID=4567 RepID=A0A9R0RDC3_TRITD|nr:unnamed protein product [Triticum turgidum subsp. durum]
MCLEFGSCFGGRRRDDYGRSRGHHGHGYWSEPAPVYRQPPIVAVHEAGHKAYQEGAPKAEHAAYLQDQAGSETPPRHPAWHSKVGVEAGNGDYTPRPHEAATDHRVREHAAMDYHHYPTTTTALARYEVASR